MLSRTAAALAALAAVALAAPPYAALAQTSAPGSTNTVRRSLPLTFNETDFGRIIQVVYESCQSQVTQLPNGPYRRVANTAARSGGGGGGIETGPTPSSGDARLDYVIFQLGSVPASGASAQVTAAQILSQIGIDVNGPASNSAVILSATVNRNGGFVTATDTSPANSQIVDAGPAVGGFDALVVVKNGTPKTLDVICDINMYYLDPTDPRGFKYGVRNFDFGDPTNQAFLLWAMGPSGAGSDANILSVCNAFNPPGFTPQRYLEPTGAFKEGDYIAPAGLPAGCPADGSLDPGDSCVGTQWIREDKTDGAIGNVIRFFGDPEQTMNFTGCGAPGVLAPAGYCDPGEPIPEEGQVSGNACNKNRGLSGAPNINISSTLEGNTGQWIKVGGRFVYVNY